MSSPSWSCNGCDEKIDSKQIAEILDPSWGICICSTCRTNTLERKHAELLAEANLIKHEINRLKSLRGE